MEPEVDATGKHLTPADAAQLAAYLARLRAELTPLSVRLTIYNNVYNPIISNFSLLQNSVERLMDGDTYVYSAAACGDWEFPKTPCPKGIENSSNLTKWLTHYHNTGQGRDCDDGHHRGRTMELRGRLHATARCTAREGWRV